MKMRPDRANEYSRKKPVLRNYMLIGALVGALAGAGGRVGLGEKESDNLNDFTLSFTDHTQEEILSHVDKIAAASDSELDPEMIKQNLDMLVDQAGNIEQTLWLRLFEIFFSKFPAYDRLHNAYYLEMLDSELAQDSTIKDALLELVSNENSVAQAATLFDSYSPYISEESLAEVSKTAIAISPVAVATTWSDNDTLTRIARSFGHEAIGQKATWSQEAAAHIDGHVADLKSFYGQTLTLVILSRSESAYPGTAYKALDEIVSTFDTDPLRRLMTSLSVHDPYVSLAIGKNLNERADYQPTGSDTTIIEGNLDILSAGSFYPQITLRDAQEIHTFIEQTDFDALILEATTTCAETGRYQALLDYYHEYTTNLTDPDTVQEPLATAAAAAYNIGDYTAFVHLYEKLNPSKQQLLLVEHDIAQSVTESQLSAKSIDKFGPDLDLERIVTTDDLPFERSDIEIYVWKHINASIEHIGSQKVLKKIFHEKEYQETYPYPFNAVPIERFNLILFSGGLNRALAETSIPLQYGNVFMMVESISRSIDLNGKDVSDENIYQTAVRALERLQEEWNTEIIGDGVSMIIGGHEDVHYDAERIPSSIRKVTDYSNVPTAVAGLELSDTHGYNRNKSEVLTEVAGSSGPTTILLTGHGSPVNWSFSNNLPDNLDNSTSDNPANISYIDLAEAIMSSGNPELRLVLSSCYSHNYITNLYAYIGARDGISPQIAIAEAGDNRYSWYYPGSPEQEERYAASFMLDQLFAQAHNTPDKSITVGDFMKVQTKLLYSESIGIIAPQKDTGAKAAPNSGQKIENQNHFIEIGYRYSTDKTANIV